MRIIFYNIVLLLDVSIIKLFSILPRNRNFVLFSCLVGLPAQDHCVHYQTLAHCTELYSTLYSIELMKGTKRQRRHVCFPFRHLLTMLFLKYSQGEIIDSHATSQEKSLV